MPNRARPDVRRLLACCGLCLLSLAVALLVIRVGLDWADTFPYSSASEVRYLIIALLALLIWLGGSAGAVVRYRRGRRKG